MKVLVIDNFDSFVYNIIQYLNVLGANVDVRTNEELDGVKDTSQYEGIVISPGPGNPENPKDRGETIEFLEKSDYKKVLGICFGHQLLGHYLGAKIKLAAEVYHGYVDTIVHRNSVLYANVPQKFRAIRYHSLILEPAPAIIIDASSATDGTVMGFHSADKKIYGIQFHPESYYSEHGQAIFQNFLGI